MTNKTSMRLTLNASTGLCLYAVYKIVLLTAILFKPLRSIGSTRGEDFWHFLIFSNSYWVMLALGLCGLLFVYADTNKTEEVDFENHFVKIKKIVFSTFVFFSIGSIFVIAYNINSSLNAYQIYLDQGGDIANNILPVIVSMISMILAVFISVGEIIFGIYILSGNERLQKVVLPIYLTGFISILVIRIYNFVNSIVFYIRNFDDFKLYNITINQIYGSILSFVVAILLATASLILVLYGMKKGRTVLDEKLNITRETAITE